jgi:hypothetical protein
MNQYVFCSEDQKSAKKGQKGRIAARKALLQSLSPLRPAQTYDGL